MIFVILPHQLFDVKLLSKYKTYQIILWEHPHYFKAYNYNKKKLILHRSSMKYYYDFLVKKKFKVRYVEYSDKMSETDYTIFDPIDKIVLPNKYTMIESPNFLLTKEQYALYNNKTKSYIFNNFYIWSKKELKLYPEIKSLDKYNQTRYSKNISIDDSVPKTSSIDRKYNDEATRYVEKHFPNNYGSSENFNYPTTHKTARQWLKNFLTKRLKTFGTYQDIVIKDTTYLSHSVLSSSINIGLLNPNDIIIELKKIKTKVPANSFEGYLRQLFWREYQRYCYIYVDFKKNYFGNKKKLSKAWYDGTLGIEPLDDMIRDGFDKAYIHHIGRLMFIGNYMNLSGIAPMEGFKWFMEFSIDSYSWVMNQNVLDMVFFVTGGLTMRRPYISSSNYIIQMSSYKKGEWSEKWDELYHSFIKKHNKKLYKFRYFIRL
jgi:deoxyribodipyrimidine photolyase-related protein